MSFVRRIKKNGRIYLAEVENQRIDGKVIQKHLRYIGREVDKKAVISISSSSLTVDKVKVYGPLLVLNSIAQQIKLPEVLGEYADEILSMVYAHCLNYKSVNNMPSWFERTDLNSLLNLSGLTESRLLSTLDSLNEDYIEKCQRKIFNNIKKVCRLSPKGAVVYDVTNTYLYGTKCQIAKLGKSKDGRQNRPLVQIGLATTQKEGLPIFHRVFDGNTHDSRTFSFLMDSLSAYNLSSGLFVYDRGIASAQNTCLAKRQGWDVLCGVPIRDKEKKFIRIKLKEGALADISNRVVINKNVLYIKSWNYSVGGVQGKLAICYNERRRLDIRESRYNEITLAQDFISQGHPIKRGLERYLTPAGRIRRYELERAEEFDGYSCIFCTKRLPAEEMVCLYFDKDVVERAFKTLKGITHLRPVRHWLYNRVVAHVFLCYLSYLLLSMLKMKLSRLGVSPELALRDLANVYKVYLSDKKKGHTFERTATLNRHQEKILKAVNKQLLKSV